MRGLEALPQKWGSHPPRGRITRQVVIVTVLAAGGRLSTNVDHRETQQEL